MNLATAGANRARPTLSCGPAPSVVVYPSRAVAAAHRSPERLLPKSIPEPRANPACRWPDSPGGWAALAAAFIATSLVVHGPALSGPFLSDDLHNVALNRYVHELSRTNALALLDPTSDVALMNANWAPVHFFVHALQWRLFRDDVTPYHLCNVALHASASTLLVSLLRASAVPRLAALLAGLFFLLHPANVEAVAWISQIKTLLAANLMLIALLWRERRPAPATIAFALALLAKALAAIALPFAAVVAWARAGGPKGVPSRRTTPVLLAWTAVFAAFAAVEIVAFQHANQTVAPVTSALGVRALTSAAIGARYLAMAATGYGVSAFQEPGPVTSIGDAWVAAALVAGLALGSRVIVCLRARREEAAWWLLAAGSWVPVAQVFPFLYPMADRYLYFILPGMIGGTLLAGRDALALLAPPARATAARIAVALAVVACLAFAWTSRGRAALWTSEARLLADTIRHYPSGPTAQFLRAKEAARRGDVGAAVAGLRVATARGPRGFADVVADVELARLRGTPEFDALLLQLARRQIDEMRGFARLTEVNLMHLAQAHAFVGDLAAARGALERALALEGPWSSEIRAQLEQLRALDARSAPPGP
jgi:hypothetical protein